MSVLHEVALELAARLDDKADFLLMIRPKGLDLQTRTIVTTNMRKTEMEDMLVEGTSMYVMDQVAQQRGL